MVAAVEAGLVAGVARGAGLFDLEEDGVGIAIDVDGQDALTMAAFFPFPPKALTAAAEIRGVARIDGFLPGIAIHPGHHEDPSGGCILGDSWDEGIGKGE